MRHLTYNITSALLMTLLVALVSCDSITEPDLPIPLEETLDNTGAFLRIVSVESAAFDLANLSEAAYTINVEYFDGEGSTLLDNIEFYASYRQFSLDGTGVELPETTEPFFTVASSAFSENEAGLPAATISVPLSAVLDGLELETTDVGVEDLFNIRWVLNLTDGRSFSADDASPAVGGGFYTSPYNANVFTVKALAADEFVGTYLFEQQNTGFFGWWMFSETFTTELSVDPDNTLNGRVFTAEPYAENFGGLAPVTVPIALGRTATSTASSIGTGIRCSTGIAIGAITDNSNAVIIDINDDSQFTMVLGDNVLADCGVGPTDVAFTVTKQ